MIDFTWFPEAEHNLYDMYD